MIISKDLLWSAVTKKSWLCSGDWNPINILGHFNHLFVIFCWCPLLNEYFNASWQVVVVPMRANVNLKACTVEEKEAQRKVRICQLAHKLSVKWILNRIGFLISSIFISLSFHSGSGQQFSFFHVQACISGPLVLFDDNRKVLNRFNRIHL